MNLYNIKSLNLKKSYSKNKKKLKKEVKNLYNLNKEMKIMKKIII